MVELSSKISVILCLLITWLFASAILFYRINTLGAFACLGATKTLEYVKNTGAGNPAKLRLNQSYSQVALTLNMSDPSNYIKTGLGFAEGKGVSVKNISPADPNNQTYMPYYFQGPGTPIIIGIMIKLFGEQSVLPYFILIMFIHLLTALLTCVLASKFFKDPVYVFGSGLLSLLFPAVLDFYSGFGIFASEPLTAPFVILSLIVVSNFWHSLNKNIFSYKNLVLNAIAYGFFLGSASYFRDIYSSFAFFTYIIFLLVSLIKRKYFKQIILFILVSGVVLQAVEYPWQKRNEHYFNEFTMSGSSYGGFGLWHQIWCDYKETAKWSWNAASGLGNYLAPEKTKPILDLFSKDRRAGSELARNSLVGAIWAKPWQALGYKLKVYDTLWFGQRIHNYIYLWCVLSTISFLAFLWITRFKFVPELWLFPLFLLFISPVVHYEHRYSQPFFLFITPITFMYLIQYYRQMSCQIGLLLSK